MDGSRKGDMSSPGPPLMRQLSVESVLRFALRTGPFNANDLINLDFPRWLCVAGFGGGAAELGSDCALRVCRFAP